MHEPAQLHEIPVYILQTPSGAVAQEPDDVAELAAASLHVRRTSAARRPSEFQGTTLASSSRAPCRMANQRTALRIRLELELLARTRRFLQARGDRATIKPKPGNPSRTPFDARRPILHRLDAAGTNQARGNRRPLTVDEPTLARDQLVQRRLELGLEFDLASTATLAAAPCPFSARKTDTYA